MILLWVMSLLLYLTWAVAQLESVLAFEIQSQATQAQYQSEFEKAEALLAQCEDRLRTLLTHESNPSEENFNTLDFEGCRAKSIGNFPAPRLNQHQMKNTLWIEMEVGQSIRMRSVFRYQMTSQQLSRINWQVIYEKKAYVSFI
jgi:hypothetical protein